MLEARGLRVVPPAGWVSSTDPDPDPDLVFDLTQGDAEILIYLDDSQSRSLDGLMVSLRYSVVIDWGGTILSETRQRTAEITLRALEFRARTPENGLRQYVRGLAVKGQRKLTIQCSAPPSSFAAALAALNQLVRTMQWNDEAPVQREGV